MKSGAGAPQAIPREFAALAQMGRAGNLELMTATQLPHKVNASAIGQATVVVCFRLDEPLALSRMRELGGGSEAVKTLCPWAISSRGTGFQSAD